MDGICKVCGRGTTGKVGIWRPKPLYWWQKKEEFDVPLCDECHQRIWEKINEAEIVGVRL